MSDFQPTFLDAVAGGGGQRRVWRTRAVESRLTLLVHRDGGLDLLVLVEHERVGLVAVGVVVGERVERLGVLALADEPTGGLGHEPDEEELEHGGDRLQDGRDAP